jgi:hypothetical protein
MKRRPYDDQDFGLKEGIPFTMYWRAHRARQELLDMIANRMEDALQVRFLHAVHSLDFLKLLEGCFPTDKHQKTSAFILIYSRLTHALLNWFQASKSFRLLCLGVHLPDRDQVCENYSSICSGMLACIAYVMGS